MKTRSYISTLSFSRKADHWDVRDLDISRISDTHRKMLTELPVTDRVAIDADSPTFTEFDPEFLKKVNHLFLYVRKGRVYLVDTQGYNYARYALELINFPLNSEKEN